MKTLISNAKIISPADGFNEIGNILIQDHVIKQVGQVNTTEVDRDIDATGLLALPGLVDLACKFSSSRHENKMAINDEVAAILGSGVTTVCCLPNKESTGLLSSASQFMHQQLLAPKIFMIGSMTKNLEGEALSEMMGMKQANYVAVTNYLHPLANANILRRALEYASGMNLSIMLYPIDHALVADGCMHEGMISTQLGLKGISVSSETAALGQCLALVEDIGASVHFCRLSCARSVDMLAQARKAGLPVTADVSINHLFLTDENVLGFDSNCHVLPPFRNQSDRDALREGVRDGVIDSICSDHCPLDINAKLAPFPSTEPGISSVETFAALVLDLVEQKAIPLERAISAVTCSAARVIGLDVGRLSEDAVADICLLDPNQEWVLEHDSMMSLGKNTPYAGQSFKGKVKQVFLNGETVHKSE